MLPTRSDEYTRFGLYYDAIYAAMGKDYQKEVEQLHQLIQQYKKSSIYCSIRHYRLTWLSHQFFTNGVTRSNKILYKRGMAIERIVYSGLVLSRQLNLSPL